MRKQAVLIIAHADFLQLQVLLKMLDSVYFDIYLHIDSKAQDVPWFSLKAQCVHSDLTILDRMSVSWGGPSEIICTLNLLETAYRRKNYSYFHLISGADLPLHKPETIWDFFDASYGSEFVAVKHDQIRGNLNSEELSRVWTYRLFPERGREQPYYRIANAMSRFQSRIGFKRPRSYLNKVTLGKGAQWFSITDKFCGWLLDKRLLVVNAFCNRTTCADELFLQSMLLSSPFCANRYCPTSNEHEQCMRLIDWDRGSPYVWRISDLDELLSSKRMFARKFDSRVDSAVITALFHGVGDCDHD